jgi:hypothetical protein
VRHEEHGAIAHQVLEALEHLRLALRVQACRRLVEQEHGRVAEQGATDRQPLLRPTGEPFAARAEDGLVAERQALDELVRAGRAAAISSWEAPSTP